MFCAGATHPGLAAWRLAAGVFLIPLDDFPRRNGLSSRCGSEQQASSGINAFATTDDVAMRRQVAGHSYPRQLASQQAAFPPAVEPMQLAAPPTYNPTLELLHEFEQHYSTVDVFTCFSSQTSGTGCQLGGGGLPIHVDVEPDTDQPVRRRTRRRSPAGHSR